MDTREAQFRAEGWAWGSTGDAREWLTIAGSALRSAELAVERGDARPPAPIIGAPQILARVRRAGTFFRILEIAPDEAQHVLVTAVDDKYAHLVTGWCSCSTWTWDGMRSGFASGWRFAGSAGRGAVEASYESGHARELRSIRAVTA